MVNWSMIGAVVLPNVGGWLGTLTMVGQVRKPDGKAWYESIRRPSWNPPNWVFGPTWTMLYCAMGYASYVVYEECGGFTERATLPLALFGTQLVINWTWTPVFFGLHKIGLAFAHLLVLDAAAAATAVSFYRVNTSTLYCMAPYLAWISFASFLNYTIWRLNKKDDK